MFQLTQKYCFFVVLIFSCFAQNVLAKQASFVEWESPIPRFSELNLDPNHVAEVAGDGLFLLILNEKNINIWSKGKIKNFPDAQITIAATLIDKPISVVREKVLDIKSMDEYMPQISEPAIVDKPDANNFMAEWIQTYKLPFLELKAKFLIQHKIEESGDISGLLLDGDIDSGAFRWELIPISKQKTLVVYSYWGDQKSAGLAFKIVMSAQPEFELSMGAITSSMILVQLKNALDRTGPKVTLDNAKLPLVPDISFTSNDSSLLETMVDLSAHGRLLFVEPILWIQGNGAPKKIRFVKGVSILPLAPKQVIPLATDYPKMPEYIRYYKKLSLEEKDGKNLVDADIRISIGPLFIKVNNVFETSWNDTGNVQTFEANNQSGFYPMSGAMEFFPLANGANTLMVYSLALDIGDEGSWLLRKGRELQEYALMLCLHQIITLLDKQAPWLIEASHQNNSKEVKK